MNREKSCGAVVFRVYNNELQFLIIESINGHFSYPKGHSENNETEVETALREIKEETNLDVTLDENFREVITYLPNERMVKHVVFFLAEAKEGIVKRQENEIRSIEWMSFDEACQILSFKNDKKILKNAVEFIKLKYLQTV